MYLKWRVEILGICKETLCNITICTCHLQYQRETAVRGMEKTRSCILQEVSFTAFSFGCNFIEFQRFRSSSQGEICTRRTLL